MSISAPEASDLVMIIAAPWWWRGRQDRSQAGHHHARYDKDPDNFLAAIKLIAARIWCRNL
ncbi:MAG TPA: hypothetical protein VIQ29_00125 [Ancylobacter sp.]